MLVSPMAQGRPTPRAAVQARSVTFNADVRKPPLRASGHEGVPWPVE